jgi:hypothetical protein
MTIQSVPIKIRLTQTPSVVGTIIPPSHISSLPQVTNTNTNTTTTTNNQQQQRNISFIQQVIQQYVTNPLKSNDTWGASMDVPEKSSIRIFFENINGLQFSSQTNRQPHLSMMQDRGIAISGFAETNTNWNYQNIRARITNQAREIFPNSVVTLSPNNYQPPVPSAYQPGGCLQRSTSHWAGRIIDIISDEKQWEGGQVRHIG